jgi:predicted alpha/beta hydrolase
MTESKTDGIATETVNGLPIYQQQPRSTAGPDLGRVIILGNAYRLMTYQAQLANALAERGFECWWFPYHGQSGTSGIFSGDSAKHDLDAVVNYCRATSDGSPLAIVAHCASCLITTDYLARNGSDGIQSLVFYGFLRRQARRRQFAEAQFAKTAGRFSISQYDWDFDPLPRLAHIQQPILFCQAEDSLNARRASRDEIREVSGACPHAEAQFFPKGYDTEPDCVDQYAEIYARWICSHIQGA